MDSAFLGLFALMCFFLGYVYLFNHTLALKWGNSRRRVLGRVGLTRNAAWEVGARRRGIFAIITGVLLLAIVAGAL